MANELEHLLEHLGALLIAQTWQIVPVFVVVAVLCTALRRVSAHWRYLLWLVVLAKCVTPPIFDVPVPLRPFQPTAAPVTALPAPYTPQGAPASAHDPPEHASAPGRAPVRTSQRPPPVHPTGPAEPAKTPPSTPRGRDLQRPLTFWLSSAWLLGVLALLVANGIRVVRFDAWLRRSRQPAPAELSDRVAGLAKRLGLRRLPRIWIVPATPQPFVWGLWRGEVHVPARASTPTGYVGSPSVLAHELAHVARRDALMNALQFLIRSIFFFHPLVWWTCRRLRLEREKCCDEMSLAVTNEAPSSYANAVLETMLPSDGCRRSLPQMSVAGSVGQLEERLRTVLRPGRRFLARPSRRAVALALVLACVALPTKVACTSPRPVDGSRETRSPRAGLDDRAKPAASGTAVAPPAASAPAVAKMIYYAGVVVDEEGRPVAGVEIRSYLSDARDWKAHCEVATTTTDEGGHFRIGPFPQLAELRPRRVLWLDHPDYGWSAIAHHRGSNQRLDTGHLRLVLPRPGSVSGRVTDKAGHPIGNARVTSQVWWNHRVYGSEEGEYLVQRPVSDQGTRTDEDGRFVLTRLPRRGYVHLWVEHPDYSLFWSGYNGANQVLPYRCAVGDRDVHIILSPGAMIRGHLVRDGQPFRHAGVTVYAEATNEYAPDAYVGYGNYRPVLTDEGGRFEFRSLPPGAYFLHAEPYGVLEPGLAVMPAWDTVATAQPTTEVEVRVVDGIALRGQVVDINSGAPVPIRRRVCHVGVEFLGAPKAATFAGEADESAEGRFEMYLPPGEYQLDVRVVRRTPVLSEHLTLVAGQTPPPLTLRVKPPRAVSGRLIDPEGRPVRGVIKAGWLLDATDDQGHFRWPEHTQAWSGKPGLFFLFDENWQLGRAIQWTRSAGLELGAIQLAPAVLVKGRIVDPQGQPVQVWKLDLHVGPKIGDTYPYVRLPPWRQTHRGDGTFEFYPVPVGVAYAVSARDVGVAAERTFDLSASGSADAIDVLDVGDIALRPVGKFPVDTSFSGVLVGQVVDERDVPVAGATVSVSIDPRQWEDRTDKNGRFRFTGLPAGPELTVSVRHKEYKTAADVWVIDGQKEVLIRLKPAGHPDAAPQTPAPASQPR